MSVRKVEDIHWLEKELSEYSAKEKGYKQKQSEATSDKNNSKHDNIDNDDDDDNDNNNNDEAGLGQRELYEAVEKGDNANSSFPSAKELWDSYVDGERDLREYSASFLSTLGESVSNYKKYYDYRVGAVTAQPVTKLSSDSEAVSSVLFQMSRDPWLSSFLVVQALSCGADVNYLSPERGESMIHNLARFGNVDAIKCIFSMVNDVKCGLPNPQGQTPLILACQTIGRFNGSSNDKSNFVKMLLERKDCRVNHLDIYDRSALFYGFHESNPKTVRSLLKKNASVISSLKNYIMYIPELLALDRAMKHGDTSQQQIHNIRQSVGLMKFLANDYVESSMIDYTDSYPTILLKLAAYGKTNVIKSMLMFKIREELRNMKLNDPPSMENKISPPSALNKLETERYRIDLEERNKIKTAHKKEKSDNVRRRRLLGERAEWDAKREKMSQKLEKEFDVKVKGLFV